jgi:hypothetical protein
VSDELSRVDEFLYARLTADAALVAAATGGIHADLAPQGTTSPWVIFQFQGGADVAGVNPSTRILVNGLWVVKGVVEAETYQGVAQAIADRIDAVLHGASGSVAGLTIESCAREAPLRYVELLEGGPQVRHLGGQYRVVAYAS